MRGRKARRETGYMGEVRVCFLPRDALWCKARYCDRMSSVCLSVTLMDCDHIGWNTSEIILPLVSLGCSLSADPNIVSLLQGEHPQIWAQSDPSPVDLSVVSSRFAETRFAEIMV